MDPITLEAKERPVGAREARAARLEGQVPAVIYGRHMEPVHFSVPVLTMQRLISSGELARVEIKVGKESWDAILKQVDFDPITDIPRHADFQALTKGEAITVTIPFQFHGIPVGKKEGGDVHIAMHDVEIRSLPQHIPSHIDVDISELNIGDTIHVSELAIENVEFVSGEERTIVTVVPPRVTAEDIAEEEALEAAAAEAEEEAIEGAEGEEGEGEGEEKEQE
jgi:large subunit ribosomal protein L25